MKTRLLLVSLIAFASFAGSAAAKESGNFVIQLGQDTVSYERYLRDARHIEVSQVGRAPRVLQRRYVYDLLADGSFSHATMVVTPPGTTAPAQTLDATLDGDTLRTRIQAGSAPAQNVATALPKGSVVVAFSSPWIGYETLTQRLAAGKPDSLRSNIYFLGFPSSNWISLHRMGRDSVLLANEHLDVFHVHVDRAGHILGVLPISGTGKLTVTRVDKLDLDAVTASLAAREHASAPMGMLSPRDTVRVANAGGAALWVDYGRPGKRGRVVYGGIVPYGELWRTGANAATQFRTDKALQFGGTVVPAGFYTLWTIPTAGGWKLVINSETGQWGTEHKTEKDLFTIDMKVSALSAPVERFTISIDTQPGGGVLDLDWDTTRASASFTTQP